MLEDVCSSLIYRSVSFLYWHDSLIKIMMTSSAVLASTCKKIAKRSFGSLLCTLHIAFNNTIIYLLSDLTRVVLLSGSKDASHKRRVIPWNSNTRGGCFCIRRSGIIERSTSSNDTSVNYSHFFRRFISRVHSRRTTFPHGIDLLFNMVTRIHKWPLGARAIMQRIGKCVDIPRSRPIDPTNAVLQSHNTASPFGPNKPIF